MQGAQGAQCLLSVLLSRAKDVVVHKRKRSKNPDLLVEREVGLKGKSRVPCWGPLVSVHGVADEK